MTGHPEGEGILYPRVSGDAYEAAFEARAAAGDNIHGEADFVMGYTPRAVLDAGCGTGRVGRELARRGVEVVGVDVDPAMLEVARERAPALDWRVGDLATVDLGRTFDLVLLAGNVMLFLQPGTDEAVVANMARHVAPGGRLVNGFQLLSGHLTLSRYDALCQQHGLELAERFSTWDRQPWSRFGDYAVSVHRKG